MTTIYDPAHPAYTDEAETRREMARAWDVCDGCRRCVDLCDVFPDLFASLDRRRHGRDGNLQANAATPVVDAGVMTPDGQDRLVDACFGCGRCTVQCPYRPELHPASVDIAALMQRARVMRHRRPGIRFGEAADVWRERLRPGSTLRRALARIEPDRGHDARRPTAPDRANTERPRTAEIAPPQAHVVLAPVCLTAPPLADLAAAVVTVYNHHRVDVEVASDLRSCGAELLDAGDLAGFARLARRNVAALERLAADGRPIIVPSARCAEVMRTEYPRHLTGGGVHQIASRVREACEFLVELDDRAGGGSERQRSAPHPTGGLVRDLPETARAPVVYHASCHERTSPAGVAGRVLLERLGIPVREVRGCAGVGGAWFARRGLRREAVRLAADLTTELRTGALCVGGCVLAHAAVHATDPTVQFIHPLHLLARAYAASASTGA